MGALDPHAHKRNQHNLPGQHREVLRPTIETAQHIVSMEEIPTDFWPSFSASEDYYSTVWFYVTLMGNMMGSYVSTSNLNSQLLGCN